MPTTNALFIAQVREKIRVLPANIQSAWRNEAAALTIPGGAPGRDLHVLDKVKRGDRIGLSKPEGQARLIHDLANIELQAMELAYRSFIEYPDAPLEFREQMAELALSEAKHLELCLDQLEILKFSWGDWPAYLNLWSAVSRDDSLLDRLLIVHRYLEATGLDAGAAIARKLAQCHAPQLEKVIKRITEEEVDHVAFGSRWYQNFCKYEKLDPDQDFKIRMRSLAQKLPKRFEILDHELRKRAGFTTSEIQVVQEIQDQHKALQAMKFESLFVS